MGSMQQLGTGHLLKEGGGVGGWAGANGVNVIPFCAPEMGDCIKLCNHF